MGVHGLTVWRAELETDFDGWSCGYHGRKTEAATTTKHQINPKGRLVCLCRKQDHA